METLSNIKWCACLSGVQEHHLENVPAAVEGSLAPQQLSTLPTKHDHKAQKTYLRKKASEFIERAGEDRKKRFWERCEVPKLPETMT